MFIFLKDGALRIPEKFVKYFDMKEVAAIFGCEPHEFSDRVTTEELQNYMVVTALLNGEEKDTEIPDLRTQFPMIVASGTGR